MRPPSTRAVLNRALVPPVVFLISFLAFGSQYLFYVAPAATLPPGPIPLRDTLVLNGFYVAIMTTYYRACATHPGRFDSPPHPAEEAPNAPLVAALRQRYLATRWCWKCRAPKPPRAHHCSACRQCIPRMDHHCPWLGNCVSMTTFPHFLRFLVWATAGLWVLSTHLYARLHALFVVADLPSYLGPRPRHMAALLVLSVVCAFTTLFLTLMLLSTMWDWVRNQTTIECKEMKTYEGILERRRRGGGGSSSSSSSSWWSDNRRSGSSGGDSDPGENGKKRTPVDPIEFPYEIGFFKNMAQAMGTSNPLLWLWPLASTPELDPDGFGSGAGWRWEENGFNDHKGMWPPHEVWKARKGGRSRHIGGWPGSKDNRARETAAHARPPIYEPWRTAEQEKAAFRARQAADQERLSMLRRFQQQNEIMHELEEDDADVPLAELARRRKVE